MSGLEPLLLPLAIGGSLIGGAVEAAGSIQEGEANAQAQEENARTAELNKEIADQDRRLAVKTAQIDAEDRRRENRRTLASVRAAFGASGGDFGGSPMDVLMDTAAELEVDAQRIEYEGRARNREGALQMLGFDRDAAMSRRAAGNSRTAGYLGAFGAVANTATRLVRMT